MPKWVEQRPLLDAFLINASRAVVIAVLVLLAVLGIKTAAFALDDPDADVPAAVRESLTAGFEDDREGSLSFANVADGAWRQLFVFPPLSKPVTIEQTLDGRDDDGKLPDSGTDSDEALLVFVDDDRVLGAARVDRETIDVSCVTATRRFTPRVAVVSASTPLRVIRTERRDPPFLAVTAKDRRGVLNCLRRMPDIAGED